MSNNNTMIGPSNPSKKPMFFVQAKCDLFSGIGETKHLGKTGIHLSWDGSKKIDAGSIRISFDSTSTKLTDDKYKILGSVQASITDEMKLHERFAHLRIKGEWYKPEAELLDFIEKVSKEGNVPINLRREIQELTGRKPTAVGRECRDWIKIANNLPVSDEPEELISIDSAAKLLGISSQTLRNWEEQGKITPQKTSKGHRRYTRSQILDIRKQQMHQHELLLPGITPSFLIQMVQEFVQSFDPLERVNLTLTQDTVLGKVRITIDSADGLTTVSKSFNIKN
jgi:hypothetical protein